MSNSIERLHLTPNYSISRVIKGGWHLAGGHGSIDEREAIDDMRAFVEAGITTFDCADIYTGVEELIGRFLQKNKDAFASGSLPRVQVHTKYVPDYNALATLTKEDTTRIIDRSLKRLGVEQLDLVQFAWWTYDVPGYVETAVQLAELQKQGKIRYIGVTNFDGAAIQKMLDAGVPILGNQVQYSIMDHRPERVQQAMADQYGFRFLCYGTIAGGFLSDRYLDAPDPPQPMENRSLTKYRLIIDEFGGYPFFQEALRLLRSIADQYEVGIAEVAAKYILQKPNVGGVIIGARNRKHLAKLKQLSSFQLNADDLKRIKELVNRSRGPLGPVYELERDKEGKHGRIMKYNLNDE
jgi:aryl-alcohol dehydrogenase-like predicted oxidoreductase